VPLHGPAARLEHRVSACRHTGPEPCRTVPLCATGAAHLQHFRKLSSMYATDSSRPITRRASWHAGSQYVACLAVMSGPPKSTLTANLLSHAAGATTSVQPRASPERQSLRPKLPARGVRESDAAAGSRIRGAPGAARGGAAALLSGQGVATRLALPNRARMPVLSARAGQGDTPQRPVPACGDRGPSAVSGPAGPPDVRSGLPAPAVRRARLAARPGLQDHRDARQHAVRSVG
jgi:hypothetical protein